MKAECLVGVLFSITYVQVELTCRNLHIAFCSYVIMRFFRDPLTSKIKGCVPSNDSLDYSSFEVKEWYQLQMIGLVHRVQQSKRQGHSVLVLWTSYMILWCIVNQPSVECVCSFISGLSIPPIHDDVPFSQEALMTFHTRRPIKNVTTKCHVLRAYSRFILVLSTLQYPKG